MSYRDRYQEIWAKRKAIYELAMKAISNSFTDEQILELQTSMDEDPNDGFFELLTLKAAELFPDRFVQESEI